MKRPASTMRDGRADAVYLDGATDLAHHLGADVDPDDPETTAKSAERRLYKDSACGAWLDLSDPESVLVGTIVEGSDVEPIVAPRRLRYPFRSSLWDAALADIETEADVCWRHANECPDDCDGDVCGYTSHAGADVVELNPGPVRARRRYRVSLSRSIVGWVLHSCRDLRQHRKVEPPTHLLDWLGAKVHGRRVQVPHDSPEAAVLNEVQRGGAHPEYRARTHGPYLFLTSDVL